MSKILNRLNRSQIFAKMGDPISKLKQGSKSKGFAYCSPKTSLVNSIIVLWESLAVGRYPLEYMSALPALTIA